jgi:hypothetical protein
MDGWFVKRHYILTIYAPMIYTAPCVMFLMRADTLRGQKGGGWALEMKSFLGPVKWHRTQSQLNRTPQPNIPLYTLPTTIRCCIDTAKVITLIFYIPLAHNNIAYVLKS